LYGRPARATCAAAAAARGAARTAGVLASGSVTAGSGLTLKLPRLWHRLAQAEQRGDSASA